MKYKKPEISVLVLDEENIITTSGGLEMEIQQPEGGDTIPFI